MLGGAYLKAFQKDPMNVCVGISRNKKLAGALCEHPILADIGTPKGIDKTYAELRRITHPGDCQAPVKITLIYAVGPFDWQGHPDLGDPQRLPDPKIWKMNFVAFKDLLGAVDELAQELRMNSKQAVNVNVMGLSSVSLPREDSQLWPAYSEAKDQMEIHIERYAARRDRDIRRSGLVVRTSTIKTDAEMAMRHGAPPEVQAHWLSVEDLVNETIPSLLAMVPHSYRVHDVISTLSGHTPEIHTLEPAYQRWREQITITEPDRARPPIGAGEGEKGALVIVTQEDIDSRRPIEASVGEDVTRSQTWRNRQKKRSQPFITSRIEG